eukprot:1242841-Pyramimonas_sp.AAC.1
MHAWDLSPVFRVGHLHARGDFPKLAERRPREDLRRRRRDLRDEAARRCRQFRADSGTVSPQALRGWALCPKSSFCKALEPKGEIAG